jgi:hypothetical protein
MSRDTLASSIMMRSIELPGVLGRRQERLADPEIVSLGRAPHYADRISTGSCA